MSRLVTIQQLIDQSRRRADMEFSAFVEDAELIDYINDGVTELYDLLVAAYGNDYFYAFADTAFVVNTNSYPLPSDFYKLIGVDLETGTGTGKYDPAGNFMERQRTRSSGRLRYRMRGDKLFWTPDPTDTRNYRLHYVPTAPRLVKTEFADSAVDAVNDRITLSDHGLPANHPVRFTTAGTLPTGLAASTTYHVIVVDGDTIQLAASVDGAALDITAAGTGPHTILSCFDGINGWENYIVVDAAISMLDKEESDVSSLARKKAGLKQRLEDMAENRDSGEPDVVQDVTGWPDEDDPFGEMRRIYR